MNEPTRWPVAMSPELDFVIHLSRSEPSPEDVRRALECAENGLDWERVFIEANEHRVIPWVYSAMRRLDSGALPGGAVDAFRRRNDEIVRTNLEQAACLFRILDALEGADIAVVTLKGLPLAMQLYGDPGARQTGDVDLLVAEGEVEATVDVLAELGFRPYQEDVFRALGVPRVLRMGGEWPFRGVGACQIDLHWRVGEAWANRRFPADAVITEADVQMVQGRGLRILRADLRLPYLLVHGFGHAWARLRWLVDVAESLEGLTPADVEAVTERIEERDAARALGTALWLMDRFWGRQVDREIRSLAERHAPERRLRDSLVSRLQSTAARADLDAPELADYVFELRHRRFLGASPLSQMGSLFTPNLTDLLTFPIALRVPALGYPLRVLRLTTKGIRMAAESLVRATSGARRGASGRGRGSVA